MDSCACLHIYYLLDHRSRPYKDRGHLLPAMNSYCVTSDEQPAAQPSAIQPSFMLLQLMRCVVHCLMCNLLLCILRA